MSKSHGANKPALRELRARHIREQKNKCCWCKEPMLAPGATIPLKPNVVHPRSATLEHLRGPRDHAYADTAAACFECNSSHVGKNGQRVLMGLPVKAKTARAPNRADTEGVPDTLSEALAQGGLTFVPKHKKPRRKKFTPKRDVQIHRATLDLEDEIGRRELLAARRGEPVGFDGYPETAERAMRKREKRDALRAAGVAVMAPSRKRAVKRGAEMFEASKPKGPTR